MMSQTLKHAKLIWEYFSSYSKPMACDAIVVCCSYDLRVCDYACDLLLESVAPIILFSGNKGNWTRHLWDRPEAEVFANRAETKGISCSQILIESRATNIGENIAFSRELLPEVKSVTFVTKPNTMLRVALTAPIQWPNACVHLACPDILFPDEVSNVIGVFGVINEMVGDIQRILKYPQLGFQVKHTFPKEVIDSWEYLVQEGFTLHMIKPNAIKWSSGVDPS